MAYDKDFVYKMLKENDDKKSIEFILFKYFSNAKEFDRNYNSDIIELLVEKKMHSVANLMLLTPFVGMFKRAQNNEPTYEVAKENYNEIIIKCNELAKELNLNSTLELSILFSYMLYSGYFSINGVHKYQIEGRANILSAFAFDIFRGGGVCLNYSDMLTDIITANGYDAATILNFVDSKTKSRYTPDIKRQEVSPKLFTKVFMSIVHPASKKMGNHACTLIIDRDKPYIFDSTNLMMFECVDNKKAVNSVGEGHLNLKPYISYMLAKNVPNYNAIEKLCLTSDYTSPYTGRDFIFNFENCVHYFNENQRIFTDFHEDIMGNITEIVKDTERAKSKRKQKIYK